ncbi:hypothetical protein [Candidatus Binatus sp.]|uniref:hypothetical protein n=1 Tax=Candidatus Binatus sp. TaxID=2811406 RepID=UPI002F9321B6
MSQESRREYLTSANVTGSNTTRESRKNRSGPPPLAPGILRQMVTNNAPLTNAVNLIVDVLWIRISYFFKQPVMQFTTVSLHAQQGRMGGIPPSVQIHDDQLH